MKYLWMTACKSIILHVHEISNNREFSGSTPPPRGDFFQIRRENDNLTKNTTDEIAKYRYHKEDKGLLLSLSPTLPDTSTTSLQQFMPSMLEPL